jgi:hypothetical protein
MKQTVMTIAAASVLACVATLPARAQAPAAPVAGDASWSASMLKTQCEQPAGSLAQAQCVSAVRGILHGYQYGVLFLGAQENVPDARVRRIALCVDNVKVGELVQDFISDANGADADALKRTPAEVAVLGSLHMHHACQ